MTFDFITDSNFRNILERDYQELQRCAENNCNKAVLILSGSIIEAVLTDYFINFPDPDLPEKKILSTDLFPLIDKAHQKNLIKDSTKEISTVIKNYRNLIHPGREVRKKQSFDKDTAEVARYLLNIIIKEIRENYITNIGFKTSDLISKLENDSLSKPVFEKIMVKVHKSEKHNLFKELVEYDLSPHPFGEIIEDTKKYILILKPMVDREIIEGLLRKMIKRIETGENWEVLRYYFALHEELNFLYEDEIEVICLYILNTFTGHAIDYQLTESYVNSNLFASFGTYLSKESVKKEFLKWICEIVELHANRPPVYFRAYDQLINSVPSDKKNNIKQYVLNNVSTYNSEEFYKEYDDGNYLPF